MCDALGCEELVSSSSYGRALNTGLLPEATVDAWVPKIVLMAT